MNQMCFSEGNINGLTLKNRIIKAATYEGKTIDGAPTDELLDFHMAMAKGGIAMTTLAYCQIYDGIFFFFSFWKNALT